MLNPFKLIKAWFIISDIEKQAVKEIKVNNQVKPGWKTTEFWLTALTQVPTILGLFLGASNPITIGVGAAAVIAYTLGRNWTKSNAGAVALAAVKAAADAATALPPVSMAVPSAAPAAPVS